MEKDCRKNSAKLEAQVHELMQEIDELNSEEDNLFPERTEEPEGITPEELEEYARRLSQKLNEGLEKQKSKILWCLLP